MGLFTLNEYTEQKKFRPQKTVFTYKDGDDFIKNRDKTIVHNLGKTVGNRVVTRFHKKDARDLRQKLGNDKKLGNTVIAGAKNNPSALDKNDHDFINKNINSPEVIGAKTRSDLNQMRKAQPAQFTAAYAPISHKHFNANLIGLNKTQIHNIGDTNDKSMKNSHNRRLMVHSVLSHEIDHKKGFEHEIAKHSGQKAREVQKRLKNSQSAPLDAMVNPKSFEVYKSLPAERSAYKVGLNTNSLRDRAFNDPAHVKERQNIFKKIEHDTRGKTLKAYHNTIKPDSHDYYGKYNKKITGLLYSNYK